MTDLAGMMESLEKAAERRGITVRKVSGGVYVVKDAAGTSGHLALPETWERIKRTPIVRSKEWRREAIRRGAEKARGEYSPEAHREASNAERARGGTHQRARIRWVSRADATKFAGPDGKEMGDDETLHHRSDGWYVVDRHDAGDGARKTHRIMGPFDTAKWAEGANRYFASETEAHTRAQNDRWDAENARSKSRSSKPGAAYEPPDAKMRKALEASAAKRGLLVHFYDSGISVGDPLSDDDYDPEISSEGPFSVGQAWQHIRAVAPSQRAETALYKLLGSGDYVHSSKSTLSKR